jgi:putative addiction module component (TIGR02574 family)
MISIADMKESVSRLSTRERASLPHWIIADLDTVAEGKDIVDAAWRQEVRARVDDIKAGKVQMIPADEMWKDLLAEKNCTTVALDSHY